MSLPDLSRTSTFLLVGGCGYVVDVATFNLLRMGSGLGSVDPSVARLVAMVAAMGVTYTGNRLLTWRGASGANRGRELVLFCLFNVAGLVLSLVPLAISHDLLGWHSALADNLAANVVGLGLGTAFRFWAYDRIVFAHAGLQHVTGDQIGHASPRCAPSASTRSAPGS